MKVLQVLPALNGGGVERGTLEVARGLVAAGHESLVVSAGGKWVSRLEAEGSRHLTLPVHRKRLRSLLQVRPFRQLLREECPDVMDLRSRVPAWIAWLAWRGMDPRHRPRLVTTVHGFYSVNAYSRIMTRGEKVVCVSESTREYVRRHYPKVPEERLVVIPRGVDPEQYPFGYEPPQRWREQWKEAYPQLSDGFVLTLPGRVTRLKGHEAFLRIVAELRQQGVPAHGVVAGGVDPRKAAYADELRRQVVDLGLEPWVHFTGDRTDLREIMAVSAVVLSLSQKPESFGRTVLEALSIGRPVLGYDYGGVGEQLAELLPEGRIPPGDVGAAVERLQQWWKAPPVPRPHSRYTLDAMLKQTLDCYSHWD